MIHIYIEKIKVKLSWRSVLAVFVTTNRCVADVFNVVVGGVVYISSHYMARMRTCNESKSKTKSDRNYIRVKKRGLIEL